MLDPITDMLNRIRNAQAVFKPTVSIPFSKLKYELAKILEKQGFVEKAERKGRKTEKSIELTLKYIDKKPAEGEARQRRPSISGLKRISKPGQRIYNSWRDIRRVRGGFGMSIISTSKGLKTNKEARRQKLGGEVLCEIW